jgi:NAD(P)H-hydrate repair Nnr-like enzyme with NAD(P)H-hydrate epimerase domain
MKGQGGDRTTDSPQALLGQAGLVVDGIVGIGGRGGLRPPAAELADRSQDLGVPVVAATYQAE